MPVNCGHSVRVRHPAVSPFVACALLCAAGCGGLSAPASARLPGIPAAGWTSSGTSWHQNSWEVGDRNSDGRVDYLCVQDPPESFNHRVWIDRDHDGWFDTYTDNTAGEIELRLAVPAFAPMSPSSGTADAASGGEGG